MNLQTRAGWISLFNGIVCIDQKCERDGTAFEARMRPEALEIYCTERKVDIYVALKEVARKRKIHEDQLADVIGTMTLPEIADILEEYDTGVHA